VYVHRLANVRLEGGGVAMWSTGAFTVGKCCTRMTLGRCLGRRHDGGTEAAGGHDICLPSSF